MANSKLTPHIINETCEYIESKGPTREALRTWIEKTFDIDITVRTIHRQPEFTIAYAHLTMQRARKAQTSLGEELPKDIEGIIAIKDHIQQRMASRQKFLKTLKAETPHWRTVQKAQSDDEKQWIIASKHYHDVMNAVGNNTGDKVDGKEGTDVITEFLAEIEKRRVAKQDNTDVPQPKPIELEVN